MRTSKKDEYGEERAEGVSARGMNPKLKGTFEVSTREEAK